MPPIPSLPLFPTASLPELVWLASALAGVAVTLMAWRQARSWPTRTKNMIRLASNGLFLVVGVMAVATPPVANPTWLSVLTPLAIAWATVGMTLIAVIDQQSSQEDWSRPATEDTHGND